MPKIIEHPEQRLMEEARRQVEQNGYGGVTIRSVAVACGMGVGTVYNYFPSKDALLAAYLLQDWNRCKDEIYAAGAAAQTPEEVLRCIHDQLLAYSTRHSRVFRDADAAAGFAGAFGPYHAMLRDQLAQPLLPFCTEPFTAEFAAEALLTWTMAGRPFDEIYALLSKLF